MNFTKKNKIDQFTAAKKGNLVWLKIHTYDVNLRNDYGETALICASNNGHKECVELLLKSGANVDIQNVYGKTALICASIHGNEQCVRLLLNAGANVKLTDRSGSAAALYAARKGYQEILKILKQY